MLAMVVEIQRISSAPLTVVGPCITGRPRAVATLQGPHEMGDKRTPVDSMKVQNGVPFINMNRLYIYIYINPLLHGFWPPTNIYTCTSRLVWVIFGYVNLNTLH